MAGMVASLTEKDMINLGYYFSEQDILLSAAKENGEEKNSPQILSTSEDRHIYGPYK